MVARGQEGSGGGYEGNMGVLVAMEMSSSVTVTGSRSRLRYGALVLQDATTG